jgi:uncharacterized protein YkwD
MPKILSFGGGSKSSKDNLFKDLWNWFGSLDRFVKIYLVSAILIAIVTPSIVASYLIFNPEASGTSLSSAVSQSPDSSKPILSGSSAQPQSPSDYIVHQEILTMLNILNSYRQQNGVHPLTPVKSLTDIAKWFSEDMANENYFRYNHVDSWGRGTIQRMAEMDYGYNTWKAENIGAGTESAQSFLENLQGSPGHNANFLSANFNAVGIYRAYNPNSDHKWYWVVEFGGLIVEPVSYVAPFPPPPPPPSQPQGLSESLTCTGSNFKANLSWQASSGATLYQLSKWDGFTWIPFGQTSVTTYEWTGLTNPPDGYTWGVEAFNGSGRSGINSRGFSSPSCIIQSSSISSSQNPCLISADTSSTSCSVNIAWSTSGYSEPISVCAFDGTTTSKIGEGLNGSRPQTLTHGKDYTYRLLNNTTSCSGETQINVLTQRVLKINPNAGDANCDGTVSPIDAILVLRYDAGLSVTGTSCVGGGLNINAADIVVDGTPLPKIDPVDSLMILRKDAGLINLSTLQFSSTYRDRDGDLITDSEETSNACLNANAQDSRLDSDGDGLNNLSEITRRTNPCKADSDNDSFNDSIEVYLGTNPITKCSITVAKNDEATDNHPLDFNDDKSINTLDVGGFTAVLNTQKGDSKFNQRYDLDKNGRINTTDLGKFTPSLNTTCN